MDQWRTIRIFKFFYLDIFILEREAAPCLSLWIVVIHERIRIGSALLTYAHDKRGKFSAYLVVKVATKTADHSVCKLAFAITFGQVG